MSDIRRSLFVVGLLLITGCAGNLQKYVEPSDDPRARVRFASTANHWVRLYSYDDKQCKTNEQEWMQFYGDYLLSGETNPSLGMPLPLDHYPVGTVKEVYVVAGKPHHLMFQSARSGTGPERVSKNYIAMTKSILLTPSFHCGTPFTMEFEEGKDYEVVFHFYASSCSIDVFDLTNNDEGQHYRKKVALTPKDIGPCKSALQTLRWK